MTTSQAAAAFLAMVLLASGAGAVEVRLQDGAVAVLAGIEVPDGVAEAAGKVVDGLVAGAAADRTDVRDRHERLRAQVRGAGGRWLQAALVGDGLAVVAPAEDVAPAALAELLALERAARQEGLGVWRGREAGPWPAAALAALPPRYLLVEGRPLEVARARGFVYVNFGRRWREDFTVRAEEKVARGLAKEGLDLFGLEGRNLRIRGFVFEEGGPMIELVHRAQVEVLP